MLSEFILPTKMDFFNVKGCSKWDDTPDDKQLHSNLFRSPAPVSHKKLKKGITPQLAEKMQENKIDSTKKRKLQEDKTKFTDIKKPRKDEPQNGKIIHPTQVEDTQTKLENHSDLYEIGDDQESEPQSPKKKKKRKRKNSLGDGGKDEVERHETSSPKNIANLYKTSTTDDKSDGAEEAKQKKKRKRKPRHNKFKDADGNVKPQYRREDDLPPTKSQLNTRKRNDNKKNENKTESKSSSNKHPINGARNKVETFEQAKEALKKKKRIRKRKRSFSESSNPDIESQGSEPESRQLSDISKSDGSTKSSKSLESVTNNNSMKRKQQSEQNQSKQDKKAKSKVKRNRGKKSKKNDLEELVPVDSDPKTTSSDEHSDEEEDDDVEDNLQHKSALNKNKGQTLRSRLENQLRVSHFRFLNEKFYTCSGRDAFEMVSKDKDAFEVYHEGYSQQVEQWPVNPVDVIIKQLQLRPSSLVVGDFGCGEAQIAQTVKQKVHSFDLCALNKHVTICDISQVPLDDESLDVAVFCLSLMGTNWIDYVKEANRVLKTGGTLKIAEVASRFQSLARFLKIMKSLGFHAQTKDLSNTMFYLFNFTKQKQSRGIDVNKGEILKPCLYKKR
ncbi:uncharacterized protein [Amphiura filiformis]|uniref:uncharacterized protein n=1 Tax=Amphiura filiformis TaxID=82378 RepID=UPI003B211014